MPETELDEFSPAMYRGLALWVNALRYWDACQSARLGWNALPASLEAFVREAAAVKDTPNAG